MQHQVIVAALLVHERTLQQPFEQAVAVRGAQYLCDGVVLAQLRPGQRYGEQVQVMIAEHRACSVA
jgi:hypothetical protein